MRQCVGCREMKPKSELVRVVRTPEGEIRADLSGKLNGRGAYLCRSSACFEKAVKRKALERALGAPVSDEVYRLLELQFGEMI